MTLRPLIRDLVRGPLRSPLDRRGGWTPRVLFSAGEQGGWWDASDFTTQFQDSAGTTPVTAAGQPVGKVLDKSGRGNHLVQATAASRPVLQQDASGFWYWSFDGVDDGWATAASVDFTGTSKISTWAGVLKASDAATAVFAELGPDTSLTNGCFILGGWPNATTPGYDWNLRATVAMETLRAPSGYAAPNSAVISAMFDCVGATAAQRIVPRINGATPAGLTALGSPTTAVGTFSNNTLFVGRRNGASLPFNGRGYQLVIRGAVSTAAEIALAERFIGGRMGIVL